MKLIDKSALVAEIDKGINWRNDWQLDEYIKGYHDALIMLKKYLDAFEVKEVDLEKEYREYVVDDPVFSMFILNDAFGRLMAKHFFELGMQVSNKEQKDNIRHSMDETPNYPCDILFVTDVDNKFLYRYMENGRPVDRETPYFHNIQNGKCWYYCNDIVNIY